MNTGKNFGKAAICGIVLTFAVMIGFSGCSEDYSPAIRHLNDTTDSLSRALTSLREDFNSRIAQLTTQLNAKVSVESVVPTQHQDGRRGYTLSLSNGEEFSFYNGTNGSSGSVWQIDPTTGRWICDGVLTEYRAVGYNAPAPYINAADTTWYVHVWDPATSTYVPQKTAYKVVGNETFLSYVTQDTQGNYTLYVRDLNATDANGNILRTIPLNPTVAVPSGGFIELLGYVQGGAVSGIANLSLSSVVTSDLALDFGRIASLPTGYTQWNYRKTVLAAQVLSSLGNKNTAIVVTTNLSSLPNTMTLKNSRGTAMPVRFGTPVALSGLLTRSGGPAVGTVYYVPIDATDAVQTNLDAFKNQFETGALYYLEAGVVKSNYSTWTIVANPKDATANPPTPATPALVTGLSGATLDGSGIYQYSIGANSNVGVTFNADSANVYDYHITSHNPAIVVNNTAGTFHSTVAVTPYDTIFVNKLLIDGRLLIDTIRVRTL
ncbi:MAG: hypothetical protein LBK07_07230 [Tannerella sp.]|nr:hypothetical protein [Tannerella sp.]